MNSKINVIYKISVYGEARVYIGSAADFDRRVRQHKHLMARGRHHCVGLQVAYNESPDKIVSFDVIAESTIENLQKDEQEAIDFYGKEALLNSSMSAYNPMRDTNIVKDWSASLAPEERQRRSEALKKLRGSEDFMSALKLGREKYLKSGGRESLSKACAGNNKRRIAVSDMLKRKWACPEFRDEMSEKISKSLSIPIVGTNTITGTAIEFSSSVAAGIYLGDKSKSGNIRSCLLGKQKTAYGYTWEYL